ncbi:MAG: alpha-amylase family glycosyl hydrolase [Treponemataceae bacterium]|nr:alpha-amylase family glycosyl hydrolase [Treponemataceae bacterium]
MFSKVLEKLSRVMFFLCLFTFFSCNGVDSNTENVGIFDDNGNINYQSPNHVEVSAAENQFKDLEELKDDWYKNSSFYHIWVKSFADSDGDGCGDFKGIEEKLDYIKNEVGCDAIWLSPIFACNYVSKKVGVNMHGYDTIDYYALNSCFGDEEDLISLINAAHQKGMKIIFDFVPNHTSDGHPWFLSSQDKDSDKRNWYLWNDEKLYWNNGMTSDTWHKKGSEYYYGAFNGMMPDLNFRNVEVREEMKNVVRYWLNRGFDGLRVDAVRYLIEEENDCCDTQATHQWFRELRKEVIDAYESPKFMVCEAWIENDRATLNEYFGTTSEPEFNMVFDFDAGRRCIDSVGLNKDVTEYSLENNNFGTYGTFLGNHDEYYGRIGTVMGAQDKLIKQSTALSLLRPSVSFIYYGNEIGQPEENWNGDVRLRGPLNWDLVEVQKQNDLSILNLNKQILSLKQKYAELRTGVVTKLQSSNSTSTSSLAYFIGTDYSSNKFLCVYNLYKKSVSSYSFKQDKITAGTSANVLIGDKDQEDTIEFTSNTVTVKNLAPYSYRLYYIGDTTEENVFDDEVFVENDMYIYVPEVMYLRGTMNNWDISDVMEKSVVDDELIFTINISGSRATNGKFEFKFDTGSWIPGQNWGLESFYGDNMSGTVSTGQNMDNNIVVSGIDSSKTYTITFNYTDLTFTVKAK